MGGWEEGKKNAQIPVYAWECATESGDSVTYYNNVIHKHAGRLTPFLLFFCTKGGMPETKNRTAIKTGNHK